jgi:carbonic anhydrase
MEPASCWSCVTVASHYGGSAASFHGSLRVRFVADSSTPPDGADTLADGSGHTWLTAQIMLLSFWPGKPCYRLISMTQITQISELLTANRGYAAARASVADPRPGRHMAVITCMDARIDVFAVLGLHLGEAHVIRNAGGRVTDDVLRSLALSSNVLGVETVVVMQHTKCGLAGVTDEELREITGADLGFFPIDDHAAALREDIAMLVEKPYLAPLKVIAGFIYDVESGEMEDVAYWERSETT